MQDKKAYVIFVLIVSRFSFPFRFCITFFNLQVTKLFFLILWHVNTVHLYCISACIFSCFNCSCFQDPEACGAGASGAEHVLRSRIRVWAISSPVLRFLIWTSDVWLFSKYFSLFQISNLFQELKVIITLSLYSFMIATWISRGAKIWKQQQKAPKELAPKFKTMAPQHCPACKKKGKLI